MCFRFQPRFLNLGLSQIDHSLLVSLSRGCQASCQIDTITPGLVELLVEFPVLCSEVLTRAFAFDLNTVELHDISSANRWDLLVIKIECASVPHRLREGSLAVVQDLEIERRSLLVGTEILADETSDLSMIWLAQPLAPEHPQSFQQICRSGFRVRDHLLI